MNMQDEVISGYLVTAQKKRMIAVYQDLLIEFDRLCRAAGMTYWVFFGTLLGAVRHRGFIPWDDDVDIMMPREDFDRLRRMTNAQFGAGEPYFLQNPVTDPTYAQLLTRFRRSDTTDVTDMDMTFLRERTGQVPYNMGMCLAIFPLDRCCRPALMRVLRKKAAYLLMGMDYRANCPAAEKPLFHRICRAGQDLLGRQRITRLLHSAFRSGNRDSAMVQCLDGFYPVSYYWHAEDFRDTVMLPYQDIQVPAPIGYDRLLTDLYGDYMSPPPPEGMAEKHDLHLDPDAPYSAVVPKLLSGETAF